MAATGSWAIGKEHLDRQIDRLVKSPLLQSSDSLCRLLLYLAGQAWKNPGVPAKEFQIATEVFGRSPNFDPRLDSTVRVQTGRLRAKLSEYYAGAGTDDELLIEIPRGSYMMIFQIRPPESPKPAPAAPLVPAAAAPAAARKMAADWRTTALIVLGLVAVANAAVAGYFWSMQAQAPKPVHEPASPSLTTLWREFTQAADNPLMVYSNAEFVGRPDTGLRYFDASRDRRQDIFDLYTGVGEVVSVFELQRLFGSMQHSLRVKRGRLLSLDDAKSNDLIFIGSPSENLVLREIPSTKEFVFRNSTQERKGDLAIINVHPLPSEPTRFFASATLPIREDYALVALIPGLGQGLRAMVLAGTTTIGTQAAVEFVTRPSSADELLTRLGVPPGRPMKPFEAVLKVTAAGGVPVQTRIVALRPL